MTDSTKKQLWTKFSPNAHVQYDVGIKGVKDAFSDDPDVSWHKPKQTRDNFFKGAKESDIFYFAMCVGYNYKLYQNFSEAKNRAGQISIKAFSEEQLWTMLAIGMEMIVKEKGEVSTEFIDESNMKRILEECMAYANGGMTRLITLMNQGTANTNQGFEDEFLKLLK